MRLWELSENRAVPRWSSVHCWLITIHNSCSMTSNAPVDTVQFRSENTTSKKKKTLIDAKFIN